MAGSAFLLMEIVEIGLAELDPSPEVPAPEDEPNKILLNSKDPNIDNHLLT